MLLTAWIEQSQPLIDCLVNIYDKGLIKNYLRNVLHNFKYLGQFDNPEEQFHQIFKNEDVIEDALEYCVQSVDDDIAFQYILRTSRHHTFTLRIRSNLVIIILSTINHEISKQRLIDILK